MLHEVDRLRQGKGKKPIASDIQSLSFFVKALRTSFKSTIAWKTCKNVQRECVEMTKTCLWWLNSNVLVKLWVSKRQFHSLLDLLYLLVQASHICICFQRSLFDLQAQLLASKGASSLTKSITRTEQVATNSMGGRQVQTIGSLQGYYSRRSSTGNYLHDRDHWVRVIRQ